MMKLLKITIPEPVYKYKNGSKVFALYFGFGNEELLRRDYAATLKQRIAKIIADSFVTEQAVFLPYHDLYCVIFRSNIDKRQLFRLCETLLGEVDTYTEGKLKIFYHFTKCVIVEEGKGRVRFILPLPVKSYVMRMLRCPILFWNTKKEEICTIWQI